MDDSGITTLEQIRGIVRVPMELKLKGLLRAYVARLSGYSRAAVTRLISQWMKEGTLRHVGEWRYHFPSKYNVLDGELIAQTDNAHGRLPDPATRMIFRRQYSFYGIYRARN